MVDLSLSRAARLRLRLGSLLPSGLYFGGIIVARGGNTAGLLVAATALGFAGFAPVAAALSFVTVFTALIGSGLGSVALRNASLAYLRSSGEFRALAGWLCRWTLISGLASAGLALLLSYPAAALSLNQIALGPLFALASVNVLATHASTIFGAILLASRRFGYLTVSNLAFGVVASLTCVLAAKMRSAEFALLGIGAATALQAAISGWGIWRAFIRRRHPSAAIRRPALTVRAIGADWFAASAAGAILTAGQFLSLALLKDSPIGIGAIGLFSVMLQMVNIFLFVPIQMSGYFFQNLVRYAERGEPAQLWRLTCLVAAFGAAFGAASFALVYLAAPWLPIFRKVIAFGPAQPAVAAVAITAGTLNAFLVSLYVASGQYNRWTGFIVAGTLSNLTLVFLLRQTTSEAGLIGVTGGYLVTACCAVSFIKVSQRAFLRRFAPRPA